MTESLYFGKPMLIFPLFLDQHDNAQRIAEKGLGLKFHPYKVTKAELLSAIEDLLSNAEVAERVTRISKRMQNSRGESRVADLVEKVARENLKTLKSN